MSTVERPARRHDRRRDHAGAEHFFASPSVEIPFQATDTIDEELAVEMIDLDKDGARLGRTAFAQHCGDAVSGATPEIG